jgi:hypothetical protein
MMKVRLQACVAAIVCAGLAGCVLGVPGVHDVNVVAVEVVDDPLYHPPRDRVLKVTFSTRRNLFQYNQDYGWLVFSTISGCESGSLKEPELVAGGTFWRNLDVDLTGKDEKDEYARIKDELKRSETHLYHTFLNIRNEDIVIKGGKPTAFPYDLEKDPQDVCYQLSGGQLWGHFRSNVAPIPKEMIASAFQRARERPISASPRHEPSR